MCGPIPRCCSGPGRPVPLTAPPPLHPVPGRAGSHPTHLPSHILLGPAQRPLGWRQTPSDHHGPSSSSFALTGPGASPSSSSSLPTSGKARGPQPPAAPHPHPSLRSGGGGSHEVTPAQSQWFTFLPPFLFQRRQLAWEEEMKAPPVHRDFWFLGTGPGLALPHRASPPPPGARGWGQQPGFAGLGGAAWTVAWVEQQGTGQPGGPWVGLSGPPLAGPLLGLRWSPVCDGVPSPAGRSI